MDQKIIKRPDGTVAEIITKISPSISKVVHFAPDGKTPVKSSEIDYSKAMVVSDWKIIGGQVTVSTKNGHERLRSESQLDYST